MQKSILTSNDSSSFSLNLILAWTTFLQSTLPQEGLHCCSSTTTPTGSAERLVTALSMRYINWKLSYITFRMLIIHVLKSYMINQLVIISCLFIHDLSDIVQASQLSLRHTSCCAHPTVYSKLNIVQSPLWYQICEALCMGEGFLRTYLLDLCILMLSILATILWKYTVEM